MFLLVQRSQVSTGVGGSQIHLFNLLINLIYLKFIYPNVPIPHLFLLLSASSLTEVTHCSYKPVLFVSPAITFLQKQKIILIMILNAL